MPTKNQLKFIELKNNYRKRKIFQTYLFLKLLSILMAGTFASLPFIRIFLKEKSGLSAFLQKSLELNHQQVLLLFLIALISSMLIFICFLVYTFSDCKEQKEMDELLISTGEKLIRRYRLSISIRRKRMPLKFALAISDALKLILISPERIRKLARLKNRKARRRKKKRRKGRRKKVKKPQSEKITAELKKELSSFERMIRFRIKQYDKTRPFVNFAAVLYAVSALVLFAGFFMDLPLDILSIALFPLIISMMLALLTAGASYYGRWFWKAEPRDQFASLIAVFGVICIFLCFLNFI